jgi:hypothetical protein
MEESQNRENIFGPCGADVETLIKKMTPPENNSQERGLPESKTQSLSGKTVAIDGKTLRRSHDGKGLFVRQRAVIRN